MPLAPGQLNRRRAPSNRINPVLSFTGETNLNRYSAVTGGTRPPVVGRERTLDPDRTKRYDSNEDHLSKYLKALEQKTAAGQRRASILIDDEISDMSLSSDDALKNVTLGKGSQFLKSNALRTSRHDNGNATTARPTAVSFQTVRTSNALQKAQAFSSKYNLSKKVSKDAVKGVDSSETVPEKVHASELYSKVESSDKSESSFSDQGFLNVKDLIDLPSLSDGTSQHGSARLPSQTNSLNASGKSESSVTTSQHLPSMSDGLVVDHKSDSDITEYEEDFEEDSVHSQASSHSTLGSKSGQDVESAESKSVSSNEPDVESSSHVNSEGATHVRSKLAFTERTPSVHRESEVISGINKETQTAAICTREETVADFFLLRSFPHAAQPSFSSYLEGMSLSTIPVQASDEMMRHHLRTVRMFKDAQQKSYETLVTALKPNFQYTTWEHTHKVLEKQRQRRRGRSKE